MMFSEAFWVWVLLQLSNLSSLDAQMNCTALHEVDNSDKKT